MTGLILSVGRVSGETAPILFTVAAYFLPRLPRSLSDQVMALPYTCIPGYSGTDIEASRPMAYGTALVLILIVLIINVLAGLIRARFTKRMN
jgi:phosphate transport system permease protein